jgi:hypothetical protein
LARKCGNSPFRIEGIINKLQALETIRRPIATYFDGQPLRRVNTKSSPLAFEPRRHEHVRFTRQSNPPLCGAYYQELDTLKALRASLESVKQVVQGIHDDLVVSQENMVEFTRYPSFVLQLTTELQEKWTGVVDQVEQQNKRR